MHRTHICDKQARPDVSVVRSYLKTRYYYVSPINSKCQYTANLGQSSEALVGVIKTGKRNLPPTEHVTYESHDSSVNSKFTEPLSAQPFGCSMQLKFAAATLCTKFNFWRADILHWLMQGSRKGAAGNLSSLKQKQGCAHRTTLCDICSSGVPPRTHFPLINQRNKANKKFRLTFACMRPIYWIMSCSLTFNYLWFAYKHTQDLSLRKQSKCEWIHFNADVMQPIKILWPEKCNQEQLQHLITWCINSHNFTFKFGMLILLYSKIAL